MKDNKQIFNTMNNYFINITKTLNLKPYKYSNTTNINEIILLFDNHISIKKTKEFFPDVSNKNSDFTEVSQVEKKNLHLNARKSSTSNSIPATNSETIY